MTQHRIASILLAASFAACLLQTCRAEEGAEVVSFYGYDDCIRLFNDQATVTLCPAAGGRVLEYSIGGTNVLYLPEGDEGWLYEPAKRRGPMNAGRFDIGPEQVVNRGPLLWMGRWLGEITGLRKAVLTSQVDRQSDVQLVRTFELAAKSSQLSCTQEIINLSDKPASLCHWSRTFAVGGGIAIVARSPLGRFPNGYVMYENRDKMLMRPEDENIEVTDETVVIKAAPQYPKLGFDSYAGWMAYFAPTNQLFIKTYKTYPARAYNEVAGLTASVWYPKDRPMVELEPIGPAENLDPGQSASFTENWWLLEHEYPKSITEDVKAVRTMIRELRLLNELSEKEKSAIP